MYSSLQIASKYLHYLLTATSGSGHGIHSPLVYDFVTGVLMNRQHDPIFAKLEAQRSLLLKDQSLLAVEDFGAGSRVHPLRNRKVKDIAASSLKPKKYARLLHRMVQHYQPTTLLELGTSLGVTTAYMAGALPQGAQLITCEGAPAIAAKARALFSDMGLSAIRQVEGNFDLTLSFVLKELDKIDFAFIDGNHREEPTVDYFREIIGHVRPTTVLVFDDIHWSAGMEAAWKYISTHPAVTVSIDMFFVGIVFFTPDVKVQQHYCIRY